jgi:GxxExxY protein
MRDKLICSDLTEKIIGCAIQVHKVLGAGFLEKFYEEALCIELEGQGIRYRRQNQILLRYKGRNIGQHRLDLIVADKIVVELKAVKELEDIHFAIALSYLKASKLPVALLFNFNAPVLITKRFANTIFNTLNAESPNKGSAESIIEFLRNENGK